MILPIILFFRLKSFICPKIFLKIVNKEFSVNIDLYFKNNFLCFESIILKLKEDMKKIINSINLFAYISVFSSGSFITKEGSLKNISLILSKFIFVNSLIYLILSLNKKLSKNKSIKTKTSKIFFFSPKFLILSSILFTLSIKSLASISELKNNKYNLYFNP